MLSLPSPRLEDGVVALRPWTEADLPVVTDAVVDPEIVRRNRLPRSFGTAEWFAEIGRQQREGEGLRLLIVDPADDRLLGATSLSRLDHDRRTADLGYWVVASERGRGIAPRAIGLLTDWAFAELDIESVTASTDRDNEPSRRLLEKLGFELLGDDRDAHYLLRVDTAPRAARRI